MQDLLPRLTLEEKIDLLSGDETGFNTKANTRLGIPAVHMTDGPLGVRNDHPTTAFPSGIAMASTFEPALIGQASKAMAMEARALGKDMLLGPCIDISRNPFGGRNFESFGEDPYLTSELVKGYLGGIRAGGVLPSVKHFAVNDQEINRMTVNVVIDERTLQEIHLRAFHEAVKAGAWTVMAAYNRINGHYASENNELLNEILKKKWGFRGFVVSDWDATHSTVEAANAGLDLEMPNTKYFGSPLLAAVQTRAVSENTIDDKVSRILRAIFAVGLFDASPTSRPALGVVGNSEHLAIARKVAEESLVLLKNEPVNGAPLLPLNPSHLRKLAVIGAGGMYARVAGGGSSEVTPTKVKSPLQALQERLPGVEVHYAVGAPLDGDFDTIPSEFWSPLPDARERGLKGEYFDNMNLEGKPKVTRLDPKIDFAFGVDPPAPGLTNEKYSVRWTGYFHPEETKRYVFALRSDDGSRLYVNDQLVIDTWYDHGDKVTTGAVNLVAGKPAKVRVEYFQDKGGAVAALGLDESQPDELGRAVRLAAASDAVVLFAGTSDHFESEAQDKDNMNLPGNQDELIRQVVAANPRTIVVLNGGNPVAMPWLGNVKALAQAWFPGQEGSDATAEILLGQLSPSGKLPVSFPKRWEDAAAFGHYPNDPGKQDEVTYAEGVFVGYRHFDTHHVEPNFPFGHGLSYSSFRYGNLTVRTTRPLASDPAVEVSFDLTNDGRVPAAEVAQLYVRPEGAKVARPEQELKAFQRVSLQPGETRHITFALNHDAFAYYSVDTHDWKADPGHYGLSVGSSSRDERSNARVDLR
ncbi:MAG: glycoside hydrolase family 3 protein [Bdellovibrionota bacterium]